MKIKTLLRLTVCLLAAYQSAAAFAATGDPDFGPNVLILDPATPKAQEKVDAIFQTQERSQFGKERYAILLKPGKHNLNILVGFYTHVAGLGQSPEAVQINGNLEANAKWFNGNATCNFWRAAENFTVTPTGGGRNGGQIKWAVSQAVSFRRIHVKGNMSLFDGGNSSGGFIADCKIDGNVTSGSQQQWFSRNTDWGGWNGGVWNMVFMGVNRPPGGAWPGRPYTVIEKTPLIREKPFLCLNAAGQYAVMVPDLGTNTSGANWTNPGKAIPIAEFYIAKDKDTAATINAALKAGKNLLLTPGIYHLDAPLQVTKADTVVLGLGYPTLVAGKGTSCIEVADVDGVKLCGVLMEAGPTESKTLLEIGNKVSTVSHAANPIFLYDIFARSGGAAAGTCSCFVTINSNNVFGDNFWLWRADHGAGAAWGINKTKNGLIVNGSDVTCYGLFVEHTQEYQVLWNGERGRTYFYQSELPYDPPDTQVWSAPGGVKGYASYKVADKVKTHEAYGLGIYAFFRGNITSDTAIEAPEVPGVKFQHMVTFHSRNGTVTHIFNKRSGSGGNPSKLD